VSLQPGLTAKLELKVGEQDTAVAIHSGDVPVLATPRLLALAEQATVLAVADVLPPATTSVGTHVELDHVEPTPVGHKVAVRATLVHVDGRTLLFEVTAVHPADHHLVGHGRVTRVVVDRARFLSRLG
jgi:predicted thioesterase